MFILAVLLIIAAYALGSLNSAILISKLMKLPDPRSEGSRNPGATNVLRMSGKNPAFIVLGGDLLKGFIPVLIGHLFGLEDFALGCIALAAVAGHVFPMFFKFQGGKGVATAFGAVLALSPITAIIAAIVWGVVLFVTRYVSLASLIATVLAAVFILFSHTAAFLPILAMAGLMIWRHKDNISRLQAGTENKFVI